MGNEAAVQTSYEGSSLLDHVGVVRRRKWIVLQAVVLVPVAAVVLSVRQSPLYRATATVLVNGQALAATLAGTADPNAGADPARLLQTQADVAASRAVAARALRLAEVRMNPQLLLKRCTVAARSDANLLDFACTDGKAGRAKLLATSYARAYTGFRRQVDTADLEKARGNYQVQIAELRRRGQTASALYAGLVAQEAKLAAQQALQNSNVSVAREAASAEKVRPRPLRNGLLGLALGGILGIALAFLLEALDTRVRSTKELERRLGLPLLGRVPAPPRWAQRTNRLVMLADPNSIQAEAFRILRTNLDFFNLEHGARTIMVTSAIEQEGKSTTVANLAVALSRAGQRVILVDLDLRRPTLDQYFDFGDSPGLTDVALGRAQLAPAAVQPPGESKGTLEVLTSGPLPADTGEFVSGRALDAILDELKQRADIVLIDSPPLLAVGDAIALSQKVDGMIVLTRLGIVHRKVVDELRRVLTTCPAVKLGFVVSAANLEQDAEAYGYGYGYGYGSGYGYGQGGRGPERERRA